MELYESSPLYFYFEKGYEKTAIDQINKVITGQLGLLMNILDRDWVLNEIRFEMTLY